MFSKFSAEQGMNLGVWGEGELVSQTGYTISLLRVLNRVSSLCKKEGDMGVYGIVVLSFFSSGIR